MKRILICGMLLVLATSLSFAQRSRGVGASTGGVGPAVGHVGPAVRMPDTGPMSPTGVRPNTAGADRTAPVATPSHVGTTSPDNMTVGPDTSRVAPDAKAPGANSGKPANPTGVPDRVAIPDANGAGDHTRISPNQ